MYRQSFPSMYPLPKPDRPNFDRDEIAGQGKIDQNVRRWLKIGDGVEDGECSHPEFRCMLLVMNDLPDETETRDDREKRETRVNLFARSEDPERRESR